MTPMADPVPSTCEDHPMAFGQQSGYPASGRQMQQLTELLHAAGHTDFRDARGQLGLTQRQAGGKFTQDEADALIAQLEAEAEEAEGGTTGPGTEPTEASPPLAKVGRREAEQIAGLRKMPDSLLAAELQRRGWIVVEP